MCVARVKNVQEARERSTISTRRFEVCIRGLRQPGSSTKKAGIHKIEIA